MAASDRFTKLSEQLDQGQNDIEAAAVDDRAKRQARVDAARKRADDRADQIRAKEHETSEQAQSQRHEVQGRDAHIQRVRRRIDDRKAERDVKHAERDAESAEADAMDAVEFAAAAIEEAEYAVVDAALTLTRWRPLPSSNPVLVVAVRATEGADLRDREPGASVAIAAAAPWRQRGSMWGRTAPSRLIRVAATANGAGIIRFAVADWLADQDAGR